MATTPTTEDIKTWIEQGDKAHRTSEEFYWKAAEGLFLANKGEFKKRQTELGEAVGLKQPAVSKYIRCWVEFGPAKPGDKPKKPWTDAWREVTGKKPNGTGGSKTRKKPDPDSPGNKSKKPKPDPEWQAVAGEFAAACSLMQNSPELIAIVVPEDRAGEIRKHAQHFIHWSTLWAKELDARFESDDDEILT